MSTATVDNTRVIPEPFGKSVPLTRRLLSDAGLSVVGEVDLSDQPCFQDGASRQSCVVLLVDTPALLFECIVLDRAAAVFLPVHVAIWGDAGTTYIHWTDPVTSSGLRPPIPAKIPLSNLCARVTQALSGLRPSAESTIRVPSY